MRAASQAHDHRLHRHTGVNKPWCGGTDRSDGHGDAWTQHLQAAQQCYNLATKGALRLKRGFSASGHQQRTSGIVTAWYGSRWMLGHDTEFGKSPNPYHNHNSPEPLQEGIPWVGNLPCWLARHLLKREQYLICSIPKRIIVFHLEANRVHLRGGESMAYFSIKYMLKGITRAGHEYLAFLTKRMGLLQKDLCC